MQQRCASGTLNRLSLTRPPHHTLTQQLSLSLMMLPCSLGSRDAVGGAQVELHAAQADEPVACWRRVRSHP